MCLSFLREGLESGTALRVSFLPFKVNIMLPYWGHLPNSTAHSRRARLKLWKKKQRHNQTMFVIYRV